MRRILKVRKGSRSPLGSVQPLLSSIKEKSCFKERCFNILLTSLIKTLFTDQLSSLRINPQTKTLILLDFSRKQEPMLTIQSVIFIIESVKRLLVLQNTTTFFSDGGVNRFLLAKAYFPLGLLQFLNLMSLMG